VLLIDLLRGLAAKGAEVRLALLGDGPLADLATEARIPFDLAPEFSLRVPRRFVAGVAAVRRSVARLRPDVVVGNHPKGGVASWFGTLGTGLPKVVLLHDPPASTVADRFIARVRVGYVCVAPETAARVEQMAPGARARVIPPGVDLAAARARAVRGDAENAWNVAGLRGRRRAVMTARLQRFKGQFDFLSLAERFGDDEVSFLVAGPDDPGEPGLRNELELEIDERGLSGRCALAGRLDPADLSAVMAGADVFVHPAHSETFGLVVVEALAVGTPVVAYATSGPSRILAGGGGEVVAVADVDALERAVRSTFERLARGAALAEEAMRAAEPFDIGAVTEAWFDYLAGVTAAR
jgi:glycosyltransferase involved in cell wall biosynthesis